MAHDEVMRLVKDLPESRRLLYVESPAPGSVRYVFVNKVINGERGALRHVKSVLNAGRRFSGVTDT